jgi:membrane protein
MTAGTRLDRRRILRSLTFWVRPAFALRVLNRFQRIAGFDRAMAIASSALTALIPLAIVASAILSRGEARDVSDRLIARYGLTGGGAQAVRDVLTPVGGTSTNVGLLGFFVLMVATLSFSRAMQRLFEQTWELKPLSVRNTLNDLLWVAGLVGYIALSWWIHELIGGGRVQVSADLALIPASALFLGWSGLVLSGRRLEWPRLVPFAILGSVLFALCLIGADVYVPHLFSVYASRYGPIGAVLAMISALFVVMLVLVACAALGREVSEELERIGRGERPPDDDVKREWEAVIAHARVHGQELRERIDRLRRRRRSGSVEQEVQRNDRQPHRRA